MQTVTYFNNISYTDLGIYMQPTDTGYLMTMKRNIQKILVRKPGVKRLP
jgi:hypothetical protein